MIYCMSQPVWCFFAINFTPHFIHFKTYLDGFGEVCIFWVYVCLVFFCFFKTDIVVFWLMLKTCEMSRMPLSVMDIFTISCLVCGSVSLFVYFVWKVFFVVVAFVAWCVVWLFVHFYYVFVIAMYVFCCYFCCVRCPCGYGVLSCL